MREKVLKILEEINSDITEYAGDNLFDAGLLDSLQAVDLICELEDIFNIDIDAKYVVEENLKTVDSIIKLVERIKENS